MTATGEVTEFTLPKESYPQIITTGPDGNLWFTEIGSNKVGRITSNGQMTEFPAPSGTYPEGITAGPGGKLWVTEADANAIGQNRPQRQLHRNRPFTSLPLSERNHKRP